MLMPRFILQKYNNGFQNSFFLHYIIYHKFVKQRMLPTIQFYKNQVLSHCSH